MFDSQNPILIQGDDVDYNDDAIPLVLIHDGGGTVFSYYCLGPLGRKVYGINNPRFFSGRPWTGGITQMCKLYVKLIQTVVPRGKILLGGWSFGGIISVELTKQLSQSNITVAGIIMIDSICPLAFKDKPKLACRPIIPHSPTSTAHTRPEMKLMVARCMKQAGDLLYSWDIPEFAPRRYTNKSLSLMAKAKETSVTVTVKEVEITVNDDSTDTSSESAWYSSLSSDESPTWSRRSSNTDYSSDQEEHNCSSDVIVISKTLEIKSSTYKESNFDLDSLNQSLSSLLPRLPPVALLRCKDYVPTALSSTPTKNLQSDTVLENGVCKVDITRDMRHLGWEDHDVSMVGYSQTIPGHHFNIFDAEHVTKTTQEIRSACSWLERHHI